MDIFRIGFYLGKDPWNRCFLDLCGSIQWLGEGRRRKSRRRDDTLDTWLRVIIIPWHCNVYTADIGRKTLWGRVNDINFIWRRPMKFLYCGRKDRRTDIICWDSTGDNVWVMFLCIIYRTIYRYCSFRLKDRARKKELIPSKIENFHKGKFNGVFVYRWKFLLKGYLKYFMDDIIERFSV